jgi:hypothetical protein
VGRRECQTLIRCDSGGGTHEYIDWLADGHAVLSAPRHPTAHRHRRHAPDLCAANTAQVLPAWVWCGSDVGDGAMQGAARSAPWRGSSKTMHMTNTRGRKGLMVSSQCT